VNDLHAGSVALLENLRFSPGEEANDEGFARALASYTDVYVNDAFGTAHRAHASTVGIAKLVAEKGIGLLMEREVKFLGRLLGEVERPFVTIIGGAKVADKIGVLDNLLARVDQLLIGGAMANTFLKAKGGKMGRSLVEDDKLALARSFLRKAEEANVDVLLPRDVVAAAGTKSESGRVVQAMAVPEDLAALDIGPRRRAASPTRSRARRPSSGTGRWACSSRSRSRRARSRSRRRWRGARARCRSSAAATRSRPCTRAAWPTRSRTSPPAAARRSSSSRARSCPASPRWRAERSSQWPATRARSSAGTGSSTARSPSRWRWRPTCATASRPCATSTSSSPPASRRCHAVAKRLEDGPVAVAAQDCFWEDKGAFTGEVSATQLADAGCKYVILGHSERRQLFGELDAGVNLKARAALRAGLAPIICVGETLAERDAGETLGRVQAQLDGALVRESATPTWGAASWPTSPCGPSERAATPRPSRPKRSTPSSARASRRRGRPWRRACAFFTAAA
jgi:triosephosphate isomerase